MIKKLKYLLGIFIFSFVGICFGNFVSAACDGIFANVSTSEFGKHLVFYNGAIHSVGGTYISTQSNAVDNGVLKYGNFFTQSLGYGKKVFAITDTDLFFWTNSGLPYFYRSDNVQGYLDNYIVCDEINPDGYVYGNTSYIGATHCTVNSLTSESLPVLKSFLNSVDSSDYFGYSYSIGSNFKQIGVCISSSSLSKSVCFYWSSQWDSSDSGECRVSNSEGLTNVNFNNIPSSILFDSPGVTSSSGDTGNIPEGGITLGSDESGINYFENRYGWNENICYVGVDNMTDLWGSSVSFQEGSGLSIFEAFEDLYGNTDLDKVYVWINSRLINYGQWFGRNGDPLYLVSYNSGTNQVDLRYENLTFPFTNNPVAVYFMSDYMTRNSEYDTMGSEIVSYCNLKINDGTFDEIIDQSLKNNITKYTEQSNKNKGLNPDGTVINIDFSDLVYTGDAFISSGVEIAFSGNTTLKNTLKEFFTTFDNALDGLDINTTNRILPTWLVSAFLFVVLFNFLRKRK